MLRDLLFGKGDPLRGLVGSGAHRLRWWICFSGALHLVMILTLLLVPASTARRELPIPVYTVDLVAGGGPAPKPGPRKPAPQETKPAQVELPPPLEEEALDEAFLEPVVSKPPEAPEKLAPPPKEKEQAKKPPQPKVKKAPPEKPKKRVVKPKKPAKPKKVVKRKRPVAPKVVAKKQVTKKRSPKRPAKLVKKQPESPKPKRSAGQDLVKRLKQRRIDDAVATARERARLRREARVGQEGGAGTVGGGKGSGGSVVKGVEFLAYRNQLLRRIKVGWAWFGKRMDLEVTVGFGVGADGEIFGLKLLKASGDASYDESVVRAVLRASPLPPPPPSYVRDFAEVEATFRPQDLDG
jgi:colicin import membrane protein